MRDEQCCLDFGVVAVGTPDPFATGSAGFRNTGVQHVKSQFCRECAFQDSIEDGCHCEKDDRDIVMEDMLIM